MTVVSGWLHTNTWHQAGKLSKDELGILKSFFRHWYRRDAVHGAKNLLQSCADNPAFAAEPGPTKEEIEVVRKVLRECEGQRLPLCGAFVSFCNHVPFLIVCSAASAFCLGVP